MTKRLATWFFGSSPLKKIFALTLILGLVLVQSTDVLAVRNGITADHKPKTVFGITTDRGHANLTGTNVKYDRCLVTSAHNGFLDYVVKGVDADITTEVLKKSKYEQPVETALKLPPFRAPIRDIAVYWLKNLQDGTNDPRIQENRDYTPIAIDKAEDAGLTPSTHPSKDSLGAPKTTEVIGYGGNTGVNDNAGIKRKGDPHAMTFWESVNIAIPGSIFRVITTVGNRIAACEGDSGGPLFIANKFVGVLSGSHGKNRFRCDTADTAIYSGFNSHNYGTVNNVVMEGNYEMTRDLVEATCGKRVYIEIDDPNAGGVIGTMSPATDAGSFQTIETNNKIHCGKEKDCREMIHAGQVLTITAKPNTAAGWKFKQWEPNGIWNYTSQWGVLPTLYSGCPCNETETSIKNPVCKILYSKVGHYTSTLSIDNTRCTPIFVQNTCGDSIVDTGEECDGGPDGSSTCDFDCTYSVCGDNIVNTLAGEECDDENTSNGDGCSSICTFETCGNGTVDMGEDCDGGDGRAWDTSTCDADCTTPTCGDGYLNPHAEACDDGNTSNGDGCSSTCIIEECGNFITESGESCDDGPYGSSSCDIDCSSATCGDGYLNPAAGEECDDGNTTSSDGCSSTCELEIPANCGDEIVDAGEECDEGGEDSETCEFDCSEPVCGDGYLNFYAGEECDDGNTTNDDGCSSTCTTENAPYCGDSNIDTGEECDDGYSDSSSCDIDCSSATCGDGYLNPAAGEECDDGNTTSSDGCSSTCILENTCGNGSVEYGEECDDGNSSETDDCDNQCQIIWGICGDSTVGPGEQCDDGNTDNNDGCDQYCIIEEYCGDNITQTSIGEACDDGGESLGCDIDCTYASCGDATLNTSAFEECDDGNTTNGDGCSSLCTEEICGNTTLDYGEECDDGNTTSEDGCSATCDIELCGDSITQSGLGETCDDGGESATCNDDCTAAVCGDSKINFTAGEDCDDGNTTNGDGCDAYCQFEIPSPGP